MEHDRYLDWQAKDDHLSGVRESPRSGSLFNVQAPHVFRMRMRSEA